jgi:hypothetical protein
MVYDFDLGSDRAVPRFQDEVDMDLIVVKKYPIPPQGVYLDEKGKVSIRKDAKVRGVREVWERFLQDYVTAVMDPGFESHLIDTGTQCWECCHRSFLQEKQEAQPANERLRERLLPVEYGEPNARMKAVIYTARTYSRNLIITHYQRELYREVLTDRGLEERRTGEFELDGFKYTNGLVDMSVVTSVLGNVPHCKVDLCGLDLRLQGMELIEPTYQKIVDALSMVRGGSNAQKPE